MLLRFALLALLAPHPFDVIVTDKAYHYVGHQEFDFYGVAHAEQHLFVDAAKDGEIRRMYWIQYEHYLPNNDHRYDYPPPNDAIGGIPMTRESRFRPAGTTPSPDSDSGHAIAFLQSHGFRFAPENLRVRFIHLVDESKRSEVMIVYQEDVRVTGKREPDDALVARAKAGLAIAGVSGDLPGRLDSYLKEREARSDFTGVVLVEAQGKTVLERGYGRADWELDVPNDMSKIFRIGSVSKPFTAIAILKLQEESKLSIDNSVCQYLARCPESWQPVSLRHLLSHTSGIPDYFSEVKAGPLKTMRALIDETVNAHLTSALRSVPGERYAYSNFGYLLLGYVCEVVTGEPWESVLRSRVFTPAQMKDTAYDEVFSILPRRARGYASGEGGRRNVVYKDHGAFAAGGLRSTAPDLLSFLHALLDRRLVSQRTFEEMIAPVRDNYALGWQSMPLFGRRAINHTGDTTGFASHIVHYLDDDVTIIVLSNDENEPAKTTACDLARIVFRIEAPVLTNKAAGPIPAARACSQ